MIDRCRVAALLESAQGAQRAHPLSSNMSSLRQLFTAVQPLQQQQQQQAQAQATLAAAAAAAAAEAEPRLAVLTPAMTKGAGYSSLSGSLAAAATAAAGCRAAAVPEQTGFGRVGG
jgi:hypothetical protein